METNDSERIMEKASYQNEMDMKTKRLLSELTSTVSTLEQSIEELKADVKNQAEELTFFEEQMKDYKEKADKEYELLRKAIAAKRNSLAGNLVRAETTKSAGAARNFRTGAIFQPKVAISVEKNYQFGFNPPKGSMVYYSPNQFYNDEMQFGPRKFVRKDLHAQNMLKYHPSGCEMRPIFVAIPSQEGLGLASKRQQMPIDTNSDSLQETLRRFMQTQNNQTGLWNKANTHSAESHLIKEENESSEIKKEDC